MKIYKFISSLYMKNFYILFFSLNIFYVTIDSIFNKSLPTFANLKILFFFYSFVESVSTTLGLVIVFAFIMSIKKLVKDNAYVVLLSFGYNQKTILKPFLLISTLIILSSIILVNSTSLAYSTEQKNIILKYNNQHNIQDNVFLKHDNTYVFFRKLLPSQKLATDIKIFHFDKKLNLKKIHYAKKAFFKNNFWVLKNVKTIIYPKKQDLKNSKLVITNEDNIKTLEGFLPNIIHTIYEKNVNFSIPDAITMISIFKKQNIDTNKARSSLYSNILTAFYPLFLIIIIFSYMPIINRLANISLFNFVTFVTTLSIFGLFKMFTHLSYHSSGFNTEVFGIIPMLVLIVFSLYRYISMR